MRNKRIRTLVLGISLFIISSVPAIASAATGTYESSHTRGIQFVCSTRDTVTWTMDANQKIKATWAARQSESGLFTSNEGYQKLYYSTVNNLYVNFKNHFTAGAVLGGQTIGYDFSVTDRVNATWEGKGYWALDV